ncbi:MAG: MotA/TolQ/ExbB proton channel family protein [Deferribacteres bacterium]|nr:MotA/TolQ/ExbB proton channel family protein [candidate division KSB1 bacterium]MCB9503980.1 MotA/TolQ/ExbB proton channel family protein [Deferribacteres bacterium]
MFDNAIRAFDGGGIFMYAILGVLIINIAIIIERFIFISVKNRIDTSAFVNKMIELLQRGNVHDAIRICNSSEAALPQITRAGLEEYGKSANDIQNALELAAMAEIPKLEKRTQYLSMFANIATLLGLLGTIFGLISSFDAVANAPAAEKATLLSQGIAVAMNTTAFGLIAAIPALLGYSYIQEKTNALIDNINENIARIYRRMVSARN